MRGSTLLFDMVFVMVVILTALSGPTLPWVARGLGVALPAQARALDVEAAPLDRMAADLLQVCIPQGSRLHGVEVGELRLPQGASVSLVVREAKAEVPTLRTVLHHGDEILVVTPRVRREQTERRLREVAMHGRLAQWLRGADP